MNTSRRRRPDPKQLESESSFYDVYNNLAEAYDVEMIKDWNESLNFLLVFAAIFSAVLTAFIVESIHSIQEDPQDVMVDVLISLANQLANGTFTGYTKPTFEAPAYAVTVNSLFFASISASLFAALASVVALQWVGQYDARLDTADPEKLALVREARLMGVNRWMMDEIIGGMPILLFISVFLFFAGLVKWTWNIHHTVGIIVLAGTSSSLAFYTITTFFAVIFPGCPYKSKLSQWLLAIAVTLLNGVLGDWESPRIAHDLVIAYWFQDTAEWERDVTYEVKVRASAARWAAQNINRSPQFYRRLILLAQYGSQLDMPDDRDVADFQSAPWNDIFSSISEQIRQTPIDSLSTIAQDMKSFFQCVAEYAQFGLYDWSKHACFHQPTFTDEEHEVVNKIYLWQNSWDHNSLMGLWRETVDGTREVRYSRSLVAFAIERLSWYFSQWTLSSSDLTVKYFDELITYLRIPSLSAPYSQILPIDTLEAVSKAIRRDIWSRHSQEVKSAVKNCFYSVLSQYFARLRLADSKSDGERILSEIHELLNHQFYDEDGETRSSAFDGLWKHEGISLLSDIMSAFLSFKLRFPSSIQFLEWLPLVKEDSFLFGRDPNKYWNTWKQFKRGPELTLDLISACDRVIGSGCTPEQRTVMARLIVESCSQYNRHPMDIPLVIGDPCIALIQCGLLESDLPNPMPSDDEITEIGPGWVVALTYWCNVFKRPESDNEKSFVRDGLLHRNESVQQAITVASSTNQTLQSVVQAILDEATERDDLIRLYTACRSASWFSVYLEENSRWESVLSLCQQSPLPSPVMPLLSTLSPFSVNEKSWRALTEVLIASLRNLLATADNPPDLPESLVSRLIVAVQTAGDCYPFPHSIGTTGGIETRLGEGIEELVMEGMMFMIMGDDYNVPVARIEDVSEN